MTKANTDAVGWSVPDETLDRFRRIVTSTTAPSAHTAAYLGEVVVHAQDVREVGLPECELGLNRTNSGGSRLARTTAV